MATKIYKRPSSGTDADYVLHSTETDSASVRRIQGLTPETDYTFKIIREFPWGVSSAVVLTATTFEPAMPTITSFTPTSGAVGAALTITGTNFTGATSVKVNEVAATFTPVSATEINATIPTTTTGKVKVTTPGGTATSTADFTVAGVDSRPVNIIALGPSLTYGEIPGYSVPDPTGGGSAKSWPNQAQILLGSSYHVVNKGANGATFANLKTTAESPAFMALYDDVTYKENWVILQEWANTPFISAADMVSQCAEVADVLKATGFKVAVLSAYPRYSLSETNRTAINNLLRSTYTDFADMLLDISTSQYFDSGYDAYGSDIFYDKLHTTAYGNEVVAHLVAEGMPIGTGIIESDYVITTLPAAFTPPKLADLKIYSPFDSSGFEMLPDGTTGLYTDAIVRRIDQDGNPNDLTVPSGRTAPTRVLDASGIYLMVGNGSTTTLSNATAMPIGSDYHIVVDIKRNGTGENAIIGSPDHLLWFHNTGFLQFYPPATGSPCVSSFLHPVGEMHRYILNYNNTTKAVELFMADGSVASGVANGPNAYTTLELLSWNGGSNTANCAVGVIAVGTGMLNSTDRTTWFNQAVPTPPTPPTGFTPPEIGTIIGYWPGKTDGFVADGSNVITARVDASGNGINMTVPSGKTGPLLVNVSGDKYAAKYNGTTQNLRTETGMPSGASANSDFSWVFEFKRDTAADMEILSSSVMAWFNGGGNKLKFYPSDAIAPLDHLVGDTHRYVVTYDHTLQEVKIYMDDIANVSTNTTPLSHNTDAHLESGTYKTLGFNTEAEVGAIASYSVKLADASIEAWFNEPEI